MLKYLQGTCYICDCGHLEVTHKLYFDPKLYLEDLTDEKYEKYENSIDWFDCDKCANYFTYSTKSGLYVWTESIRLD